MGSAVPEYGDRVAIRYEVGEAAFARRAGVRDEMFLRRNPRMRAVFQRVCNPPASTLCRCGSTAANGVFGKPILAGGNCHDCPQGR